MRHILKHKPLLILCLLIIIGGLLHSYNLNWGAPFYFHPDERNIASSVSQLHYPENMNPHFFAYGSLPIYLIYFTGMIVNAVTIFLQHTSSLMEVTFDQAIIISRFYSALFATALIPLLFLIGKILKNEKTGLIAAFFATTSVGFLQFAHFGTFEMWLTFFSVLLFWLCLQKINYKTVILMGFVFGILVATKVSSITLLPLPLFALIIQKRQKTEKTKLFPIVNKLKIKFSDKLNILIFLRNGIVLLFTASLVYFLTNPFVVFDTLSFRNSMQYESSVVLGTLLVFYTGEFFNTIPILFQFTKIYPFLLNPLITILFILSFIYLMHKTIKTKNFSYFLLFAFYILLFLPQAFLFAKWTRYMVPTLPFIFLIVAIALSDFPKMKQWNNGTLISIALINTLFAFSYFITAFVRSDTRFAAYNFAQKTISPNSSILGEVYDLGIVPFNQTYPSIILFNFYDLDNKSPEATPKILQQKLSENEYIILPSQRIIKPRLMNKEKFPQGNMFYTKLSHGELGYIKIYETPCDFFCNITYLGSPVLRFEETANVFDRPTVMIFKKFNDN